jgi:HIV Tat-specific factor 1
MALHEPNNSDATNSPPPFSNFPQDPSEFDSDPRISFSKLDNKFILETEDGQEYSYDTILKRWIPTVCPRLLIS